MADVTNFVTGLATSLNAYLGTQNALTAQDQLDQRRGQRELENKKQLTLYEKTVEAALRKPTASVKYGNLKKLNPALANLGLDDNTEIPMEHLSEFSGLLPKDHDGGSGTNPYMSIPEASAHLYMLGVPDDKIAEITERFTKSKSKGVLKSVLDDVAKSYGARPQDSEGRIRIFASAAGIEPSDPKFMEEFRKWNDQIDSYLKEKSGAQMALAGPQLDQAATLAEQLHEKNMQSGMSGTDSLKDITTKLTQAYKPDTVQQILSKIDMKMNPKPAEPHPGFIAGLRRRFSRKTS